MRASRGAWLVAAIVAASCGGRSTPTPPPSNHAEPTPDAMPKHSCYPYDRRDGVCLTKCDWTKPFAEQGCAKSEWPLLCNRDGTCTPEMNFD